MNTQNWKPRFFIIWIGQAFSLLGSSLVGFALIWWLTTSTGSATVLALATLAGMLPQIVLSPFAGVIVDRFSRRIVMLAADSAVALTTLLLLSLFAAGLAQPWHVFVAMFIRSAGGAFHFPAMQASTSLMVPEQHLSRVAGMNQTLQGLMSIAAPPLGALLISVWPIHQVLLIDIVTALLAIGPLLVFAIPQPPKRTSASGTPAPQTSFTQDLREGLRYVLSWRGLSIIMLMAMALNFLLTPAASLIPILVTKYFGGGAPQMAMQEAAWGAGAIAGGLLLSVWGGFKRRILTSMLGLSGIGLGFLVIGLLPPSMFVAAVVCFFFLGITNPITNGPIFAVLQSTVAPEMQGRVMSLLMAASGAMTPLSLLVAGPIADALGVQVWFIIGGVVCLLIAAVGVFIPALMNIEDQMKRPQDGDVPVATAPAMGR